MDDYDFFNNSLDNAENNPSTDPNAIEIPDENISDDFDFSTLTEPKDTDEEKELTEFLFLSIILPLGSSLQSKI